MAVPFVTLDSRHTKDIDDAFRVTRGQDGYLVEVAIANAAHHVQIGSDEDVFAKSLAATTYAGKRTATHMLPPHISEHAGSLVKNAKRHAVVLEVKLSNDLEVELFRVRPTILTVEHQLCYEDLHLVLEAPSHPAYASVKSAADLSTLLLTRRRQAGALAFYDLSQLLVSNEEGNAVQFDSADEAAGYVLVQELMILVNCESARYLVRNNIPAIFRNHEARLASPPAGEVAQSVQMLLMAGSADARRIRETLNVISSTAQYGETVKGHYGLTVPAYAHVTSPLRRYADLVNQRQLLAFSKQMPFPYGQAEIAEIALGINEVLEQKKQERSQSFKEALVAKTARALETTRFSHLANHEILKALELSGSGGVVPERLVQELAVRLTADEGADRLAFSVLTMALHQPLAPELASACAAWLAREPGKVVSFLTHAANTGALLNVQIKSRATCVIPPVFEAVARVSVRQRETERVGAEARQSAKKDAERTAVLRLIKTITGLPLTIPDDVASEQNTARPGNSGGAVAVAASRQAPDALESVNAAKNQLVELTQKLRWPAAVYVSTAVGEAHKVQFSCVVSVVGPDGQYTGSSSGASTKKAGEMAAAADLLQKLAGQLSPEKARSAQVLTHASNAISAINEWAQRNDKAAPEYTYWSSKPNIGPFVCTVKILGVAETGSGRGNNKKDAKMKAAENMCQKLL